MSTLLFWLGTLWAFPTTFIGALLWLVSWSDFLQTTDGALVLEARGVVAWFFDKAHKGAMTIGGIVFVPKGVSGAYLSRVLTHELVHFKQARIFGVFFLPAYFGHSALLWLRGQDPYRDNWFEVQARKESGEA